jgi:hypothetical protein
MKYVEKHFSLRIYRRDGTSKLLLGVTGIPPKVGSIKASVGTHPGFVPGRGFSFRRRRTSSCPA